MDRSAALKDDDRKKRLVKRLIEIAFRHGIYMSIFDSSDELLRAVRDQRSGRLLRKALEPHGDGEITITGVDGDCAAPPGIWPAREHAVMFALYARARKAAGQAAGR